MTTNEQDIAQEVTQMLALETELKSQELELMQDPRFAQFLQRQKQINQELEDFWQRVESTMIENDIRSIKGDFGSLTIAERIDFDIDMEQLPAKFIKKVANTTKIRDTYRLEGKSPKGATPSVHKNLTKRLKGGE